MDVVAVLTAAFRKLPREKQENLIYHAERGTNICCREMAYFYTDGSGAG